MIRPGARSWRLSLGAVLALGVAACTLPVEAPTGRPTQDPFAIDVVAATPGAATPSPAPAPSVAPSPSSLPFPAAPPTSTPVPRPSCLWRDSQTAHGFVVDDTGQPVEGATVRIKSVERAVPFDASALTINGNWEMPCVPMAVSFEASASRPGWTTRSKTGSFQMFDHDYFMSFGRPRDGPSEAYSWSLFLSDSPEVERTEPPAGKVDVDPANVTIKLTFSEPFDTATQQRLAMAVRLWPADAATGNEAAYDLTRDSNVDAGDGLETRRFEFRPEFATATTRGAIRAGPGERARATWDAEGRVLTFAVDGSLGAADKEAAYQVGLISDGAHYMDAGGNALGTNHLGLRDTPVRAGQLLANAFLSMDWPLDSPGRWPDGAQMRWNAVHAATSTFMVRPTNRATSGSTL